MIALCVDDEYLLLNNLVREVKLLEGIQEVVGFEDEDDALEWEKDHTVDIAFLDIKMHHMGGLLLAQKLREHNPQVIIFFCTGYKEYGYEAMQLHADAYLLKPVRAEKIKKELELIQSHNQKQVAIDKSMLTVNCYGAFEVYDAYGHAIKFRRKPSKEMLAYLIYHEGKMVSGDELCTILWDETSLIKKDYLRKTFKEMQRALEEYHLKDILVHTIDMYGVDMSRIELIDKNNEKAVHFQEYRWANPR